MTSQITWIGLDIIECPDSHIQPTDRGETNGLVPIS